jgi:hypothetical protein
MTLRVALVVAILAAASAAAALLERRRATRRPVTARAAVPQQVDRADFARPDAPWLVVLFSSSACESCASMATRLAPLASPTTAVDDVEFTARRDVHEKYGIDAVPVVGVYDADGVVHAEFVGPTPADRIWAAVTALRGG